MSGGDLTPEVHADGESERSSAGGRGPVLLAAALALVLVVGVAVLGFADDDGAAPGEDDGVLVPLAPTEFPQRLDLVAVRPPGSYPVRDEPWGLMRSDVEDPYDHELFVLHQHRGGTDTLEDDGTPVDLAGVEGRVHAGSVPSVQWTSDDGAWVLNPVDADHADELVELARSVVAAQGESGPGVVPPGWTAIRLEPSGRGSLHYEGHGVLEVSLYPTDESRVFALALDRARCARARVDWCLRDAQVRGVWADAVTDPDGGLNTLSWSDPSGWWIVLRSSMATGHLVSIAHSLEPTTWDELAGMVVKVEDEPLPRRLDDVD